MRRRTHIGKYDAGDHVMPGPKGLLAATLLQAIDDARKGNGYAERAREWFDSDREGPFSFLWTCEALTLDPSAVRKVARIGKGADLLRDPYR